MRPVSRVGTPLAETADPVVTALPPTTAPATGADRGPSPLRIGLLVCDHVDDGLRGRSGDYPDMFRRLFADHPGVDLVEYDLTAGRFPTRLDECDGWLTTGSRRSVYEEEGWIARLAQLVREAARRQVPFVGVCFGHQMIAHALGGTVRRSQRGWGVGVKLVDILAAEPWMAESAGGYAILNSHADQIVDPPTGAEVLGGNEHCPISMMRLGQTMLGIQGHPEFDVEYSRALMEARRGVVIPEEAVRAGLLTLGHSPDRDRLAGWIVGFLRQARHERSRSG